MTVHVLAAHVHVLSSVCAVCEFGWEQSDVLLPWQALLSQVGSI